MVPFLILAALLVGASAQVTIEESCPDLKTVEDFKLEEYTGLWYEIQRYPTSFQQGLDCVTAKYSVDQNGRIEVRNSGKNLATGVPEVAVGEAVANGPVTGGKLLVKFDPRQPVPGDYWVLDTDYVSYAIVWSCQDLAQGKSSQTLWILSRSPSLEPEDLETIRSEISGLGLHLQPFYTTQQSEDKCQRL